MKIKKISNLSMKKKHMRKKHVHISLIGEEGKKQYAFIKDFNTFLHYHTVHDHKTFLLSLFKSF